MIFDVTFRLWLVMNAAWLSARKKTALAMFSDTTYTARLEAVRPVRAAERALEMVMG